MNRTGFFRATHRRVLRGGVLAAAGAVALQACDAPGATLPSAVAPAAALTATPHGPDYAHFARALAMSLGDPAAAAELQARIAGSTLREDRVDLGTLTGLRPGGSATALLQRAEHTPEGARVRPAVQKMM